MRKYLTAQIAAYNYEPVARLPVQRFAIECSCGFVVIFILLFEC